MAEIPVTLTVESPVRLPVDSPLLEDASLASLVPSISDSYGAVEDRYIQLARAASAASDRMQSLRLAPKRSRLDNLFPETETSLLIEIRMIAKSSLPLIATLLLQYSLTVASVYAVGNLGPNELAAVSLSNLLASISSYGIIQGIASALSTLCPQAYGRKDYTTVGLQSLRCTCLLFLLYIPIFAIWYWGSYPLLYALVPEQRAAYLASIYLRRLVFGVPGFIVFEVVKQYLQAQGIFHASTYVLVFCAPLNIILNLQLVNRYGFIGAPTAVVVTNWLMAIALVIYAAVYGSLCWCGFSREIFLHWSRLLALAGPGVLMIEAEWLAFEIIAVASSRFGTTALAAQSIVATACVTAYQIPYAVSVAASTRVAWYIGSACRQAAISSTTASLLTALVSGSTNVTLLCLLRGQIALLFSHEEPVVDLASHVLLVAGAYQLADSVSCVAGGILRGQGRQYIGGRLNLIGYYAIALPISYLCGFVFNWELAGLWMGVLVALTTVATAGTIAVLKSDWEGLIRKSVEDGVERYERAYEHGE
ncbi:DEKNAAC101605 [Brettanomyces naardenensis]|uniref:DEKNAAC101605 n=1 Tax=Brettanomyces naardenensis TaxID=13370 RepID=A0A448YIB6_BRENA|nr:DEKNAAC101605 [Brettanomyces naardenensis]